MSQRGSAAIASGSSRPTLLQTDEEMGAGNGGHFDPNSGHFDPYASVGAAAPAAFAAAGAGGAGSSMRAASPPPGAATRPRTSAHQPSYSAGSYEPLLANFSAGGSPVEPYKDSPDSPSPPPPPPRNPRRMEDAARRDSEDSKSMYEDEDGADSRLDPVLRDSDPELRDDIDYSRPVLGVRNATPEDDVGAPRAM